MCVDMTYYNHDMTLKHDLTIKTIHNVIVLTGNTLWGDFCHLAACRNHPHGELIYNQHLPILTLHSPHYVIDNLCMVKGIKKFSTHTAWNQSHMTWLTLHNHKYHNRTCAMCTKVAVKHKSSSSPPQQELV